MGQQGALLSERYRLEEVIGQGAMAGVWRAFDRLLDRPVAIKLLRPEFTRDRAVLERFRREAHLAALISHPNVASVYDYAIDGDAAYIVMQLVEGPDLASVIEDHGRLPVDHSMRIAAAVSDALQAAHDVGLVHRDIKPGNILLDADGEVRVIDFGIARALADTRTTHPNAIMATVRYCSPEQITGAPVGAASDVYSLGLVLHELLTGVPPFEGTSAAGIALARVHSRPPVPSLLAPDVPDSVDQVVMQALAIDPSHRYGSARQFGEGIRGWFRQREQLGPVSDVPAGAARALASEPPIPAGLWGLSAPVPPVASALAPVRPGSRALAGRRPLAPPRPDRRSRPSKPSKRLPATLLALIPVLALLVVAISAWTMLGVPIEPQPTGGVLGASGTPASDAGAIPAESVEQRPAPATSTTASSSAPATPNPTIAATPTATSTPAVTTPAATPQRTPATTPPPAVEPGGQPSGRLGPAATVALWYRLVEAHRFRAAAERWSRGMRDAYPPGAYIDGRFSRTTKIDVHRAETTLLDQSAGRALVEVDLTEYRSIEPSPRRFLGSWELIRVPGGWLLNEPRF
jgi:eukaryotic-like serine/threonine-protein kinase